MTRLRHCEVVDQTTERATTSSPDLSARRQAKHGNDSADRCQASYQAAMSLLRCTTNIIDCSIIADTLTITFSQYLGTLSNGVFQPFHSVSQRFGIEVHPLSHGFPNPCQHLLPSLDEELSKLIPFQRFHVDSVAC